MVMGCMFSHIVSKMVSGCKLPLISPLSGLIYNSDISHSLKHNPAAATRYLIRQKNEENKKINAFLNKMKSVLINQETTEGNF